jgi:hypothetical protein
MLHIPMSSLPQSLSGVAHLEPNVPQPAIENVNGKTPARGSTNNPQRRAFGDISNRKGLRPQTSTHKSILDSKPPSIDLETVVKPKHDPSAINEQNLLSKPKQLRRVGNVQFVLPESLNRTDRPPKTTIRSSNEAQTLSKISLFSDAPPDEVEIERPAGRLYNNQLSFDWDDDLTASLIEGATTFRQDWIDTLQELHECKLQMVEQKIEESIRNLEKFALQDIDGT